MILIIKKTLFIFSFISSSIHLLFICSVTRHLPYVLVFFLKNVSKTHKLADISAFLIFSQAYIFVLDLCRIYQ